MGSNKNDREDGGFSRRKPVRRGISEEKRFERILRESEIKYRLLFEKNPLAVMIMSCDDFRILAVNEAAVRQYGYSRDEFLRMSAVELRPPEDVPKFLREMKGLAEIEVVYSIPARHRRKNGEIMDVEISAHKFEFENRLARFVIIQDVTERNRLAAAAQQQQMEKIEILESITESFVSFDREWRYTYLNSAAEKYLRRPAKDFLGKCVWEVFPTAVGTKFDTEFHRAVETGENVFFEEYFAPYQSWTEVHAFPRANGLAVFYRDITERRRAEQLIGEKNQLLEQTYDAIFIWNLDDGIIYWNQNAERLYGYSPGEALGADARRLLKTVYPSTYQAFIGELNEKGFWEGEFVHTTKAGEEVVVEGRLHIMRRDAENLVVLETLRDVSERRQIEAKMARAAQLSLVGELAAGLAHEIKNPLSGIKGVIDILIQRRTTDGDDDEREIMENVHREIERIDQTVRVLLQRSRLRPLEIKLAPLDETVRRAAQLAPHQSGIRYWRGAKFATELDMPPAPLLIPHDSAGIEDAVLNLIINAIEAIRDRKDGKITVRLSKCESGSGDKSEVLIEVTDNGCGIPTDKLEWIFSPFQTSKNEGTGLGLAAVKRIVRAHGGECQVRSKVGAGSTFTIRLPIDDAGRT